MNTVHAFLYAVPMNWDDVRVFLAIARTRTLGGAGRVHGEVYAIVPALERRLDKIEGLYPAQGDEYFKRVVDVTVQRAEGGAVDLRCIVYEYNPRYLRGAGVLIGGDWLAAA